MAREVSAAPSWVQTTIAYLTSKGYAMRMGGPGPLQLLRLLQRIGFQRVESELAGENSEQYAGRLEALVKVWDEELHRQMREFLDEGGEAVERAKMIPPAPKVKRVKKPPTTVFQEGELADVDAQLHPASEHAPHAELEAALEAEQLARDPRLGAW